MLDTNVLISVVFFPGTGLLQVMEEISWKHDLVIPTYVIEEFKNVIKRKFPHRIEEGNEFLDEIRFESLDIPLHIPDNLFQIRDPKDYPILYAAVHGDVDVFITGDKDFDDLDLERPEILTPSEFLQRYAN